MLVSVNQDDWHYVKSSAAFFPGAGGPRRRIFNVEIIYDVNNALKLMYVVI